ncbi:MAG TPA: hypothetical protein PK857_06910 [Hyphomicrobium sp.]|nr:hypothetical protein [Hyphomicrobium sp.]HRO48757.1 hypothetical protein [Hyphomicrobium sp.]
MSQQALEQRVGELETGQARQEVRLGRIESDVGKITSGVEKLLERDARRPQALTWQAVAATCVGMAAVAVVGWWLIETAPAVRAIDDKVAKARADMTAEVRAVERRVDRLDDPEIGRVPAVERRVRELEQWAPRVTRY